MDSSEIYMLFVWIAILAVHTNKWWHVYYGPLFFRIVNLFPKEPEKLFALLFAGVAVYFLLMIELDIIKKVLHDRPATSHSYQAPNVRTEGSLSELTGRE